MGGEEKEVVERWMGLVLALTSVVACIAYALVYGYSLYRLCKKEVDSLACDSAVAMVVGVQGEGGI